MTELLKWIESENENPGIKEKIEEMRLLIQNALMPGDGRRGIFYHVRCLQIKIIKSVDLIHKGVWPNPHFLKTPGGAKSPIIIKLQYNILHYLLFV